MSVCPFRQRERTEESSGQPVPVPRGKKRLSGSNLDDSKTQEAGLQQTREQTTPQKRPADGAACSEVCYSLSKLFNICVLVSHLITRSCLESYHQGSTSPQF